MSSKSETGHAINIGKYGQIVDRVEALGATYNPPKDHLKLPALVAVAFLGNSNQGLVNDAATIFFEKTNIRKLLFNKAPLLMTDVIDLLIMMGASDGTIEDGRGLSRKMRGKRSGEKEEPAADDGTVTDEVGVIDPERKTISVSQLSFVNQAEHVSKFVSLVKTQTFYLPNESEFALAALEAFRDSLKTMNGEMSRLASNLFTARNDRNLVLYKDVVGMYDMSLAIKKYVRTLLGHTDPRFKAISKIILTKPSKPRSRSKKKK